MRVPDDPPARCPVCDADYDSVSVHAAGLMVNLLDNERYRRVCFAPVADAEGRPEVSFYHHTHEQVGTGAERDERDTREERSDDPVERA
jgi:hypothetical protein